MRVPNFMFKDTRDIKDPWHKVIGKLVLIAFYFLLHVGEYTYHNTQCHTQQFWLGDIIFCKRSTNPASKSGKQCGAHHTHILNH